MRIREAGWLACARGNQIFIEQQMIARRQVHGPLVTWRIMELKVRMESQGYRHWFDGAIFEARLYGQRTVFEAVCHRDAMREWKLRHHFRMFCKFQPACGISGTLVSPPPHYRP